MNRLRINHQSKEESLTQLDKRNGRWYVKFPDMIDEREPVNSRIQESHGPYSMARDGPVYLRYGDYRVIKNETGQPIFPPASNFSQTFDVMPALTLHSLGRILVELTEKPSGLYKEASPTRP